uniref:Uncharacterized protein n=1 Tax=Schistosoma mansoni TaxID=6183 RepID=A0AA82N839_SCHMA
MKVQVSSSSFRMALFVTGIVAEMKGKSALYGKRKVPAGEDPWKY